MIDKILILTCDRPDLLSMSLDSIPFDCEKIAVLDKPTKEERIEKWKSCEAILNEKNIPTIKNKQNKGCTPSMFSLLKRRVKGVNLILEDDIVLVEDFVEKIMTILDEIDQSKPFIIKLSDFYWGWIANDLAIDLFEEFRETDVSNVKYKDDIDYKAIRIFQHQRCNFPWDEIIGSAIKFCDINLIQCEESLTKNIGIKDSSRIKNTIGLVKTANFAMFKNGQLHEIGKIEQI